MTDMGETKYLYHYYESTVAPFLSYADLSYDEALEMIKAQLERDPHNVNPRPEWFISRRREMESKVRKAFIAKGGKPQKQYPYYMTLGVHDAMKTWFGDAAVLRIPADEFDLDTVSFTYGDMFAVMNPALNTGEPYWGQVYTYPEIVEVIVEYGFPEPTDYNARRDNWKLGGVYLNQLLKYVEAHIWSDDVTRKYREMWESENLSLNEGNL
jgi:hypothetical protein